jgi:probable phosphoglycerate mutase
MARLLLLRHAQSEWNASGRWQGRADPDLSEKGRVEARLAAQSIDGIDFLSASPLRRALHSASIIGDVLGIGPVLTDDDLQERDVGEWSGLTNDEIDAAWPGHRSQGLTPSGWESTEALLERALAALGRLERRARGGVGLVVTHAGLIRTVEEHLGAERRPLANLAGRWIDIDAGAVSLGERTELLEVRA